jgi:TonB family protein
MSTMKIGGRALTRIRAIFLGAALAVTASCHAEERIATVPEPKPKVVPLSALEKTRISGENEIHLPPSVRDTMSEQGVRTAIIMVKFCLDAAGSVTSADIARSSGYPEADQNVTKKMRDWKFRPYSFDGQDIPVCTVKMFKYLIVTD